VKWQPEKEAKKGAGLLSLWTQTGAWACKDAPSSVAPRALTREEGKRGSKVSSNNNKTEKIITERGGEKGTG